MGCVKKSMKCQRKETRFLVSVQLSTGKKRQENLGSFWNTTSERWSPTMATATVARRGRNRKLDAGCQRQCANQVRTWGPIDGRLSRTCADHYGICSTKQVRVERRLDAILTVGVYEMCGYMDERECRMVGADHCKSR